MILLSFPDKTFAMKGYIKALPFKYLPSESFDTTQKPFPKTYILSFTAVIG